MSPPLYLECAVRVRSYDGGVANPYNTNSDNTSVSKAFVIQHQLITRLQ